MARSAKETFKSQQDFILLSEFAEIRHGPQPMCTIPEGGEGTFDTGAFSVRIFSTDFQQGQSEDFSISPDSQVLLTEANDGLFAYVHYFALNDIQARGYMRQYSLSYLTTSPSKLIDHFESLQKDIFEVTSLFKCGNHTVFMCDLKHKLADLQYSLQQVTFESQEADNVKNDNFQDDIPETNKFVLQKDIEFTNKVIEILEHEMATEHNIRIKTWIDVHQEKNPNVIRSEGNSLFYTSASFTNQEYQPKRIMAHLSQRFTRQLRSLEELSPSGHMLAISALKHVLMKHNRSELALAMVLHEVDLLSKINFCDIIMMAINLAPISSLLCLGRVPFINVSQGRSQLTTPSDYKMTDQQVIWECNAAEPNFELSYFLHDNHTIAYIDHFPQQQLVSRYNTPDRIPSPTTSNDQTFGSSEQLGLKDTNNLTKSLPIPNNAKIYAPCLSSNDDNFYAPTSRMQQSDICSSCIGLPNHKGYPLISSVDLIERVSSYKPGKEILSLLKDLPELGDILYSILIGRPLIIIGDPHDEKLVRKYIRTLWLFVGGYSSHYQVIPWQEHGIELKQLPNICLVGVSSNATNPIPNHLKRHLSYWDWTKNLLCVPNYTGHLLNPILTRTREKKNEEILLTLIESVLLELSLKLFVYYHGYCIPSEPPVFIKQPSSRPEASPRKLHSVSIIRDKVEYLSILSIKGSDIDIIEHLTDIIRHQQLNEWFENDDVPPTVILRNHYCQERVCKPKQIFNQ